MSDPKILTELIESGRQLLADCSKLQDTTGLSDSFPKEQRTALADTLTAQYHSWYAKSQANLPDSDAKEFVKQYEGTFFAQGAKAFFSDPFAVNPLHSAETAKLMSIWLHPFTTLKERMLVQLTILERRRENRPAVLRLGESEVKLPRNLKGHQTEIEAFLEKSPFEQNVFLMMKYRDHNRHVGDIIRAAVEGAGLKLWLASDVRITDELATNVVACLLCCKYGIALFDEPEDAQHINPNVAYELGMLHLLDRACLILKSTNVQIQSDLLAKLYVHYDPQKPGELISLTKNWLLTSGAANSVPSATRRNL